MAERKQEREEQQTTLLSKEGFSFIKNKERDYTLYLEIENNNIILQKIIDFNLIKLIYDLNGEIYEKINLKLINENEAIINLLIKNLFQDLGLVQKFSYIHMSRVVAENKISFFSQTIKSERPPDMPPDSELMPIENMIIDFYIITPHKIKLSCNILFQDNILLLPVIEKIFSRALFKIFTRVKQFIENVIV